MLRCERLESITPAVSLQLVPLLGIEQRPEWGTIAVSVGEMASRVTAEVPLVPISQPYTLSHAWGSEVGPRLPADTLRVYVGLSANGVEYGSAAPGGWSASGGSLPRSWGGYIGLDLNKITTDAVDLATVVRHETGHVLGLGHSPDPVALMAPTVAPHVTKDLTHSDADALSVAGWNATPRNAVLGHTRFFGIGTTLNGWVMIPNSEVSRLSAGMVRVPDVGGWAYSPVYADISPL